jgi:LysM repeat protein
LTDATNGGGPGRAGPEFQTKRQAIDSPTGGEKSGTLASFLGATPKDSNLAPTGLAKLAYDGGIFGTIAKGIAGGVKNLVKPATYEVQEKDNLSKIAAANNMTLEQLLAKNPGLDPKTYDTTRPTDQNWWAIRRYSNSRASSCKRRYDGADG